jgi:hypothetical protein
MEGFSGLGRFLIIIGAVLIVIGVLVSLSSKIPFIGRLPGDIYIKRDDFTFYFPLATSILISIIITLILYLFRK